MAIAMSADLESAPLVGEAADPPPCVDNGSSRRRAKTAVAALVVLGTLAASVQTGPVSIALGVAKPPSEALQCAPVTHLRRSPCAHAFDESLGTPANRLEAYAACTAGGGTLADRNTHRPYRVPALAESRARYEVGNDESDASSSSTNRDAPFALALVHIPKSGGSTLATRWTFLARQSNSCVDEKLNPERHSASFELAPDHDEYPKRCVLDASTEVFVGNTVGAMVGGMVGANSLDVNGRVANSAEANERVANSLNGQTHQRDASFSRASLDVSRRTGEKLWVKGEFSMGTCDLVNAPCGYVTALRDPVERLLSHWRYICLQGAEGKEGWLPGWKKSGVCPLDVVSFWQAGKNNEWGALNKQGHPEQMISRLAPGADPSSKCALQVAKDNLKSRCVRFLLLDRMEHGSRKLEQTRVGVLGGLGMRDDDDFAKNNLQMKADMKRNASLHQQLPDDVYHPFVFHDEALGRRGFRAATRNAGSDARVNSGDEMSEAAEKRWTEAVSNPATLRKLKALVPNSINLYNFALHRYEPQWDEPFEGC